MVYIAKSYGLNEVADYWEQVILMNEYQKERFTNKLITTLYNTVSDKKITFFGWAFKKDTNDTRESPAIYVADALLNEEAHIIIYDPKVSEERIFEDLDYLKTRTPEENRRLVTVINDPYEACDKAHAIAILTEWDEFKEYDWKKIYQTVTKPAFVFDGRKLLDGKKMREIGFTYSSIGTSNLI